MTTSAHRQKPGPRLRTIGLCFGVFTLLYGGSFYTRDWRPMVSHTGQLAAEQARVRSKVARHSVETKRTEGAVSVEPEVTGALLKNVEPVMGRPAAQAATPASLASARSQSEVQPAAPPRLQVQSAASLMPVPVQHRSHKQAQAATAPAAPHSPAGGALVAVADPIQFRLAERGN